MSMNDKMQEALKDVVGGILEAAEKERKQSEPYKDMFKRTNGKPFPVQLREVESEMVNVVLNYTSILEENGYKLSNEGYHFLLALPFLANVLEKDITEKEGRSCCVDKTYELLHQEFYKFLSTKQ